MRFFVIIIFCLLSLSLLAGKPLADWPQFRGPNGNGYIGKLNHPIEWSKKKNLSWSESIPGGGWSSPIVVGDRVFLTTAVDSNNTNPNLVQQTLGLSGVIDPELLKKPVSTYRNTIAFASHGKEDATIPIHYARETVGLLADNNPEVLFKEYPVGHTIAQDNFSDLIRWLVR